MEIEVASRSQSDLALASSRNRGLCFGRDFREPARHVTAIVGQVRVTLGISREPSACFDDAEKGAGDTLRRRRNVLTSAQRDRSATKPIES